MMADAVGGFVPRNHQLKQTIDRARRAWLEIQGGYLAVEEDACELDSLLGVLAIPVRSKRTKVDVDLIQRLYLQGWTMNQIAAHVGCSRSAVCYWTNHGYRLNHVLNGRLGRKAAA